MKRVLHYVGKMNRCGIETFIMNLYRNIDRNQIQFDFAIHGSEPGDFEDEIKALGGEFYSFPHMRQNPRQYRKAWRTFWQQNSKRYTAFHMHTNSLANIIALEEAAKAGVPIRIVHSHNSMANKGRLQWLNDLLHRQHQKKLPRLATQLFACSDKAADWLFGGSQVGSLSVMQINNGVEVKKFSFCAETRDRLRASLGLENNKVIGHIGSFLPVKNHRFLIDIAEQAYRLDSSVRCLLIGRGPLLEEMQSLVRQKGLENVVLFLGVRDDIHELLSAMDLFIMPSLYEGLPVSLVEVQTNGLPALIADTITKNVALQPNLHYLSLTESAESWAEKALAIMNSGERAADNRCIAEKGFDMSDTALLYQKIILEKESGNE